MLLSDAIDELRRLVDLDLDFNVGDMPRLDETVTSSLTDAQKQQFCDILWYSARRLYQDVDFEYSTVTFDPLASDQQFNLHDDVIGGTPTIERLLFHVDACWIADTQIQVLQWSAFEKLYSTWRTNVNGSPIACAVSPDLKLIFDVPFSIDAIATGGIYLKGRGCPRRFDAGSIAYDWDCHPLLQWAVIRNAIPYSTDAYVDSPQALQRLKIISELAQADRRRYDDLQADLSNNLYDMPTSTGAIDFL